MKLGFGLNVEQTQKLIMTPELRQAITVLQLSSLELVDYVEQELQENPLLEVKEEQLEGEHKEKPEDERFDLDWQEYFTDRSDLGYVKSPRGSEERENFSCENFLSTMPTLQEHLNFQLSLSNISELERRIGEFLIGNTDSYGYVQVSVEEAARYFCVSENEVEKALFIIQSLEPPGVGARNLAECLILQLDHMGRKTELLEKLIKDHLEDVAAGRYNKLSQLLGLSAKEIQEEADIIKTLDPKPGREFASHNQVRYVVPDVVVERVGREFVVLVNDVTTPRLMINNNYKSIIKQEQGDYSAKKFLEEKLNSASWLIKSIEQRRLTMYKVASTIVDLQRDFLDKGIRYLKPMTLKQVADIIEMHESTVSRATANKYVQTPQGIFELKYFFGSGVTSSQGETTSAEGIKKMLQELIEGENKNKPYSDQKLAKLLEDKGIKISRRTVAKYRDGLGIPNTVQRKRF
ncbi:RNA polymerase sigma-54 factor [Desulfitispora alkaliphila]|uniref:RNA polymerase factor sigma-54 n=1 Tax=Desulfitispora alkaliphila TaxID=622674 RepID=UPI003D1E9C0D